MIKDTTFLYQIVIADVIFFYENLSFIYFWVFPHLVLHLFLWFLYFDEVAATLNEYITIEWQIYIIVQFNDLKSKNFEEIFSLFIYPG